MDKKGIPAMLKSAIDFYRFVRSLVLAAATERLMSAGRRVAEESDSALAFRVVKLPLAKCSRLERWAAYELATQGRAMIRGGRVEIGVSMISPAVLEAMSWRGRF